MKTVAVVEFFSIIFLLISFCGLLSFRSKKQSSNHLLICFISCIAALLFDSLSYIITGPQYPYYLIYTLNVLSYTVGNFVLVFYSLYCYEYISEYKPVNKWFFYVPSITLLLLNINIFVMCLAGKMFVVENGYAIEISSINAGMIIMYIISIIYIPVLILIYRKTIGKKAVIVLSTFGVSPFVSSLIKFLLPYDDYTLVIAAISLCVLYMLLQRYTIMEQEKENAEISKRNLEIQIAKTETALRSAETLAALSSDYEAVHIADLDHNFFKTVHYTNELSMNQSGTSELTYSGIISQHINTYVIPDERKTFLEFADITAMKQRLEKRSAFSYRYSVLPNKEGTFIYEMRFVRIGDKTERHVIIIGIKCIDNLLKIEREEVQYNAALLHECQFFYEFDVTEGLIRTPPKTKHGYDPLFGHKINYPISYDDFNAYRTNEIGITAATDQDREYWTCEGLKKAFNSGKRSIEIRYSSKDLRCFWRGTVILTEETLNHHLHAVYICKDVTESILAAREHEIKMEKALQETQKANAAKSEFLSRMSHDIRTPLNGIIGILEINEKHSDDLEFVAENRNKARIAANHLLSLINDILDMSKLENDDIKLASDPINLYELLEDTFTICNVRAKENGITISYDGKLDLKYPNVFGSELHLKQIFMNILTNSIKYNKLGGTVHASCHIADEYDDNVVYQFILTDTGIGMSKEFIEHIFEPFTQEHNDARSRFQGTGMGMAIVKKIIDKMNGTIKIESEPGVGSTFELKIPFKINYNADNQTTVIEEKRVSIKGLRVLLVEDNELNMEIAQCILQDFGAEVTIAENGQAAVDKFIQMPAGSYDLILMDIMMPVLDGYSATRLIRDSQKADASFIPIIAMTANAFEEDKKNAISAGMNAHISKPINTEELLRTLSKAIEDHKK